MKLDAIKEELAEPLAQLCARYADSDGEQAYDELIAAVAELIEDGVQGFCTELQALDSGPGDHGRWPTPVHSNGQRLSVMLEAIRKRRDA